jgi:hypothetical protein
MIHKRSFISCKILPSVHIVPFCLVATRVINPYKAWRLQKSQAGLLCPQAAMYKSELTFLLSLSTYECSLLVSQNIEQYHGTRSGGTPRLKSPGILIGDSEKKVTKNIKMTALRAGIWAQDYGARNKDFSQFLDAFAKLRKAIISFVMSVCLSVHPSAWIK